MDPTNSVKCSHLLISSCSVMKLLTNVEVAIEMFSHASFTFIALLKRKKDGQDHVDRLILTSAKEIQSVGPFTRATSCILQELII